MSEISVIMEGEHDASIESRPAKPLLDKPVICLLLDPQPLEPFSPAQGQTPEEMKLRAGLRPMYTPLLITDRDTKYEAFEDVELIDYFGPFRVYRPKGTIYSPGSTYQDRSSFRERRINLVNWCHLPEMDKPLLSQVVDEETILPVPTIKETTPIPLNEALTLRSQLAQLLDEDLVIPIQQATTVGECPEALYYGLYHLVNWSTQDTHPRLYEFSQTHIKPLFEFTEKEKDRIKALGNGHDIETIESLAGLEGYEAILDLIESQSRLLVDRNVEYSHKGVLIPFAKFTGDPSYSPNATVNIVGSDFIVSSGGQEYRFPLPEKGKTWETAYKGGVARMLAKIALGEDVSAETPLHDVDVVLFGKGGPTKGELAQKHNAHVQDIERIAEGGYEHFCATRDNTLNEVLVTKDGVFLSYNALSSYYQGLAQTADDNRSESLFNQHIFSVYRPDLVSGKHETVDQVVYVGKERFPTPVALARMMKLLVDGKCDGIAVPEGIRKIDPGIYWCIMTKKILGEADPQVREAKLDRMLALARTVDSRFYRELPQTHKHDPSAFINRLKAEYPDFQWEGEMNNKDTVSWFVHRLRNQILNSFMRSVGHPQERRLQKKLGPEDLDMEIITLPPMEAYGIKDIRREEQSIKEQIRIRAIRDARARMENAAVKQSDQIVQVEKRIRNFILKAYGGSNKPEVQEKIYYVPIQKRQALLQSFANDDYIVDYRWRGAHFYVYGDLFSFAFLDERQDPIITEQVIFEELYHSSGKRTVTKEGLARQGYSVERTGKDFFTRTSLLEEGLAGLEWVAYKKKNIAEDTVIGKYMKRASKQARKRGYINSDGNVQLQIGDTSMLVPADFVTFTSDKVEPRIFSTSASAASLLHIVIQKCGGDEMVALLRSARQGDITSLREVAKRIHSTFGSGSYASFLKIPADDVVGIERLRMAFQG